MEKCLLSIDWDYFIKTQKQNWGSHLESKKTAVDLWYKLYFQVNNRGRSIQELFELSKDTNVFWDKMGAIFQFKQNIPTYVSDSHALSYRIAKDKGLNVVYLFDAHADLGYGGLSSLNFEVNCANWLGKLLKEGLVKEANIVYSPFTLERPEYFADINKFYNVRYLSPTELEPVIDVEAVHICRSGAWTPPWYDDQFVEFVKGSGLLYQVINCPPRKWNPKSLSFAAQIDYLLA
ncbi:MAG: arginase [Zhaonellaceae bacterium]|jgi:hypothetical protein